MDNNQKVYQTTGLSPDIVDKMVIDDSPVVLYDEFWPFLGVDLPVANLNELDFKIILLKVRRQVLNILGRYPESKWDEIKIVEYELQAATDKEGNAVMKTVGEGDDAKQVPVFVKKPKRFYNLVELLDSLESKVYIKMCRGREGFTLNALTMDRTQLRQDINDARPVVLANQATNQASQSSGSWGL